jgi:hypothetical protein
MEFSKYFRLMKKLPIPGANVPDASRAEIERSRRGTGVELSDFEFQRSLAR